MTQRQLTCLVADDHPALVAAVTAVLREHGVDVVDVARDGEEALAKIEALAPDVALVDVRMPKLGGVDLARRVAKLRVETAVMLYTGYGERALLMEALDAGVRGVVLKEAPLADLVRAIEVVADGETYIDPVLGGTMLDAHTETRVLTQRERDVLRLLADGLSNDQIGKALFISPETVRTHVRKAMAKLGADTRTEAVAKALRQHLIA